MAHFVAFDLLLALFCWPGYVLAKALYPSVRNPFFRIAAGFVFSLGVFALAAWPCLWFRSDAEAFWVMLGPLWLLYFWAAFLVGKRRPGVEGDGDEGPGGARSPAAVEARQASRRVGFGFFLAIVAYLGGGWVIASSLRGLLDPNLPPPWIELTCLGSWVLLGVLCIPDVRHRYRLALAMLPDSAPPAPWTAVALAAIAVQVIGVALSARPDWDDSFYLNAVHQYAAGGALNREDPSFPGEALPVAPHMRLLAWELWGATLCRFSGVNPLVSHHSLLPPALLILVFAAHWHLLGRFLIPRRLVPLAILGLSVCWVYGNSSYNTPGNYLLTRTWQGKTVLWGLGLPIEVIVLWEFLKAPSPRAWLGCVLSALAALAMSSSAVYLLAALVPAFCLALINWGGLRVRRLAVVAAMASAGGLVVYALAVRSGFAGFPVLTQRLSGHSWMQALYWGTIQYGSSEIYWVLVAPLLAALIATREARAYLIGMPLILLATILNPAAYEWVALNLTSYWTYNRLFWLFPVALGLACVLALAADFLAAVVEPRAGSQVFRLLLALGLAAGLGCLPGRYVWSTENAGPYPGLDPSWGDTVSKVPADLLPILRRIEAGDWRQGRLLFPEPISQFFAPYQRAAVRFVCSRPSNTVVALAAAGRPDEGHERVRLAVALLGFIGTADGFLRPDLIDNYMEDREAEALLKKYQVRAVVLERPRPTVTRQLAGLGYRRTLKNGAYELWEESSAPLGRNDPPAGK